MAIKNLMAATQTKREGNFLKLFSPQMLNRSTSARLPITVCGFVSVCPCTRFQFNDKLNGANSTKPLLCAGRFISTKFNLKTK